jgi:hypothetical protein
VLVCSLDEYGLTSRHMLVKPSTCNRKTVNVPAHEIRSATRSCAQDVVFSSSRRAAAMPLYSLTFVSFVSFESFDFDYLIYR